MYLGVDVGGTKTLVATLDGHGVITEKVRFPTPATYDEFLRQLKSTIANLKADDFQTGGLAIPGEIDREHGRVLWLGNLPGWSPHLPLHVLSDVEKIADCPMVLENDAKLGGLSEAMLRKDKFSKVLYVTVSTGIGTALISDGAIDTAFGDGGGRTLLLEHRDKMVPWESFASGHAIVERYHHKAMEIEDPNTWRKICRDLAKGLIELIAITDPEVVVIGGSVGVYFSRYGKILTAELKKYHLPLMPIPPLQAARRPEEAVVYGCYDLAKQVYGHARAHS
ncbi:MAG TPA: ROK family protein [Verrucomicrobiae bacterium]|nr:ROK family protein [Verrucomicrobiae bacterium]